MKINDSLKIAMKERAVIFFGMLLAANSAALAIYAAFYLMGVKADYWFCVGAFLGCRVILFMANKQMPLNDENVKFMSSERLLWNLATIAVATVMICLKLSIDLLMK